MKQGLISLRRFFIALIFLFCSISSSSAETITKSFEIGTSTTPSSNYRTFAMPCRTRMVASVTFSRAGAAGSTNDVPIFVEVREPGTTADEEGPVVSVREGLIATRTPKTVNLPAATSSRSGCAFPWRVRVKHDAAGPAPVVVSGNITVSFNNPTTRIDVAGSTFGVIHNQSVTKNIGDLNSLGQGLLVITGTWNHSVFGVTGPLPVELEFELIDPNGNFGGRAKGYSSNETNDLTKLRLTRRIKDCVPGQWKIIVKGHYLDDVKDVDVIVHFTLDCP